MSRTNRYIPRSQESIQTWTSLQRRPKILYETHRQDLYKTQKLQQRRLRPFTITKRVTNATYRRQDDNLLANTKTVHGNHLVEYYPEEETLPPMMKEHVLMDRRHEDFYERFIEQWTQKFNNPKRVVWRIHSQFLLNLYVLFLLHYIRNESATLAMILESTVFTYYHRQCQ